MTEEQQESKEENDQEETIQFHVPSELEYVYRDIFNVYSGTGDVLIEFGNKHRAMPGQASISNRIVLSVGDTYLLVQTLQQALQNAQEQMQQVLSQKV